MFEKIDISIVAFNSEKWITLFMESLLCQNYPLKNINLYFSDNGSQDNTIEAITEYKAKYENEFGSFSIMQRMNDGFGAGHNYNIKFGKSKYILVTNLDLEFETDAIEIIVNSAMHDMDKVASWELRQKPYEHPKDYDPLTLEVSWSSSACILFDREAFNLVGGYEEKIFMYGEDVEISYRLRDHGYLLKYIPKAVCWHYAYEHKNQVKKLQFYGSVETNICLRIRYGTLLDVIQGFLMYFSLFFIPMKFEHHKRELFRRLGAIISNSVYYFRTKKRSETKFKFVLWDYELLRDGSFYEFVKHQNANEKELVSIIVRTYSGRLELLKQAVKSISNQTYRPIQIVIVEDGSNEMQIYSNEADKLVDGLEITYANIGKAGRCRAGNTGLDLSKGRYICFLDDDDLLYADHIEVLVNEFNTTNGISAVYSSSFEVPSKFLSLAPLEIVEKEKRVFYRQEFSRSLLWNQNYIPIQSILFDRGLYETHGGFDECLDNLEDWNLWTRYALNTNFLFVDKTTSLYRVPMDSVQKVNRQKKMNEYYQLALAKQSEMVTTISISEINEIAIEYAKNKSLKRRLIRKIAGIMRRSRFTTMIFNILRKVYFEIKK